MKKRAAPRRAGLFVSRTSQAKSFEHLPMDPGQIKGFARELLLRELPGEGPRR